MSSQDLILAFTGASGAIYGARLLQVLLASGRRVHLTLTPSGQAVLAQELGLVVDLNRFRLEAWETPGESASLSQRLFRDLLGRGATGGKLFDPPPGQLRYHHYQDFLAPIASGSFRTAGMVICPCSGTTLSAIAHSSSSNLVQRAAEVQLKERRPLVVVPREAPLSTLQIENLQRVASAGGIVLPASPGWYHGVANVADLVDFVVARICDQLGIEHELMKRWGDGV